MNSRLVSVAIVAVMIASGLMLIAPSGSSPPMIARAMTSSGDLYGGTGNWTILNPTTYTDENLAIHGNISIQNTLTLTNVTLTIDEGTAYANTITIQGADTNVLTLSRSTLKTTATSAHPFVMLQTRASGGGQAGHLYADNSTFLNVAITVSGVGRCRINNCTLNGSNIASWIAATTTGPLTMYNDTLSNLNTSGETVPWSTSLISIAGNGSRVSQCTFLQNILFRWPSIANNAFISIYNQSGVTINRNTFPNVAKDTTQGGWIYVDTSDNININNNTFGTAGTVNGSEVFGIYVSGNGSSNICSYNTFAGAKNGSVAINIAATYWTLRHNTIGLLDCTYTGEPHVIGVFVTDNGVADTHTIVEGLTINEIKGPNGPNAGATAWGVVIELCGGLQVQNSVITKISQAAIGIGTASTYGNIAFSNNAIDQVLTSSVGVAVYFGVNPTATGNTFSYIDGTSIAIAVRSTATNATIANNTVTRAVHSPTSITPTGVFSYYGNSSVVVTRFEYNFVSSLENGRTTYEIIGGAGSQAKAVIMGSRSFSTLQQDAYVTYDLRSSPSWTTITWNNNPMSYSSYFTKDTTGGYNNNWLNVTVTQSILEKAPYGFGLVILTALGIGVVLLIVVPLIAEANEGLLDTRRLIVAVLMIVSALALIIAIASLT